MVLSISYRQKSLKDMLRPISALILHGSSRLLTKEYPKQSHKTSKVETYPVKPIKKRVLD